jgi:hypothetical protein
MKKIYTESQKNVTHDHLIQKVRDDFGKVNDPRAANCSYSLTDILMSVFAMFTLKYESLLEFDTQPKIALQNLETIFGVTRLASDSCIRKVLDKVDWKELRQLISERLLYLSKLDIIDTYRYLSKYTLYLD